MPTRTRTTNYKPPKRPAGTPTALPDTQAGQAARAAQSKDYNALGRQIHQAVTHQFPPNQGVPVGTRVGPYEVKDRPLYPSGSAKRLYGFDPNQKGLDIFTQMNVTPEPWKYGPLRGNTFLGRPTPQEEPVSPVAPVDTTPFQSWQESAYRTQFDADGRIVGNRVPGPNGEELPGSALAWDKNGRAYFGPGLAGKLKEWSYKLFEKPLGETGVYVGAARPGQTDTSTGLNVKIGNFEASANVASRLGRAAAGLGGIAIDVLSAVAQQTEQVFSLFSRQNLVADATPGSALVDPDATPQERYAAAQAETQKDYLYRPFVESTVLKDDHWLMKLLFGDNPAQQIAQDTFSNISPLGGWGQGRTPSVPVNVAENQLAAQRGLQTLASPALWSQFSVDDFWGKVGKGDLPFVKEESPINDAYKAGTVLYSSWGYNSVREEYIRRLRSGADPYILRAELESPWKEMGGQLLFDPLNVIGMGHKAAMASGKITNKLDELFKVVPEVEDVMKLAADAPEAQRALAITKARDAVAKVFEQGAETINKLEGSRGLMSLNATGKRNVVGRQITQWMDLIVRNRQNDDEVVDALEAMYHLASPNADDKTRALSMVMDTLEPRHYFSQSAVETSYVLRNIIGSGDDAAAKFLEGLRKAQAGGIEDVVKLVQGKIDNALADIFPTVTEKLDAANKLKQVAEGTLTVTEAAARKLKTVASGIDAINPAVRALARMERHALHPVFSRVNTFLAGVYMGLSPAFAFRNAMNNMFTGLIDYGPGVFRHLTFEGASKEIDAFGVTVAAINVSYGAAKKGIEATKFLDKFMIGTKLSGINEKVSAANIAAKAVSDVFEKMMVVGKGIPDVRPLVDAGMSAESARYLARLLYENKGNVKAAVDTFRKAMGKGSLDAIEVLAYMGAKDAKTLTRMGMKGQLVDLIAKGRSAGKSMDEVIADVRAWKETVNTSVKQSVTQSMPRVANDAVGVEAVADLAGAAASGHVDEQVVIMATHHTQANTNAMTLTDMAANEAYEAARHRAMGNPQQEAIVKGLWDRFKASLMGDEINAIKPEHEAIKEQIFYWERNAGDFSIKDVWANPKYGFVGEVPKTHGKFIDQAWEQYYPQVRKLYQAGREHKAAQAEALFTQLKAMYPDIDVSRMDAARKYQNFARQWDNVSAETERGPRLLQAIADGRNADAARIMADMFGIPSISGTTQAGGAHLDRLVLNLVNKYAPEGTAEFKTLSEIPPDIAQFAFINQLAERAGLPIENFQVLPQDIRMGRAKLEEMLKGVTLGNDEKAQISLILERYGAQAEKDLISDLQRNIADFQDTIVNATDEAEAAAAKADFQTYLDTEYNPAMRKVFDDIGTRKAITRPGYKATFQSYVERTAPEVPRRDWNAIARRPEVQQAFQAEKLEDTLAAVVRQFADEFKDEDKVFIHGWLKRDFSNEKDAARMARAFLEFLQDGKAPTKGTREIFTRLQEYVGEVYGAFLNTDGADATRMSDEARDLFDSLLNNLPAPHTPDVGLPPPPLIGSSATPTMASAFHDQLGAFNRSVDNVITGLQNTWDTRIPTVGGADVEAALARWAGDAERNVTQVRGVASAVANEAVDFSLHNYGAKTNFDTAAAYIFPYEFWYRETYAKWMQRVVADPYLAVAYYRYKDTLAKVHAGMPEWWKYNISTNDLLGTDSENPMYFNLEQTLWPLNGITGIDFNDPQKRTGWFTSMVDQMGKYGPSVWTPYTLAIAASLSMQGNQEAAARWAGRLIPQTAALKAGLTWAGAKVRTGQGLNELDPAVNIFSGGIDPYERRRIGRELGIMEDEGLITHAEALDATWMQKGDLWDQAFIRSQSRRAPGQLTAFFAGVGFKARNQTDLEIDQFDQEYRRVWAMSDSLSPEELEKALDELREKYPFGETVILSRKSGLDRDRSYAYSVLGRIPPGYQDNLAELAGIDYKYIRQFYDSKGKMQSWNDADRTRFMSAIVDMGAVLDLPSDATRQEWQRVRADRKAIDDNLKATYGSDILEKINLFYAYQADIQGREAFLASHPDVEDAMREREAMLVSNAKITPYYTTMDKIEKYYNSVMYDAIKTSLGPDIMDKWNDYDLKLTDAKAAKAYYKAHPELSQYSDMKAKIQELAAASMVRIEGRLFEVPIAFREDANLGGLGASSLYAGISGLGQEQTPYDFTATDWQAQMSPNLWRLTLDNIANGKELSSVAEDRLQRVADDNGISLQVLLRLVNNSLVQQ